MTSITRGSQPDTRFSGMCSIGYRGPTGNTAAMSGNCEVRDQVKGYVRAAHAA